MIDKEVILGVILAGGKGTRLENQDKGLLKLQNKTLIENAIERLGPQVADVVINANGDPVRFREFGKIVVPDTIPGFAGPLAGVLAGLDHAEKKGFSHIVTVAVDTPFFPKNLVSKLAKVAINYGGLTIISSINEDTKKIKQHPTFGMWPCHLRKNLEFHLMSGQRKIVIWTKKQNAGYTSYKTSLSLIHI